jgi:hypothetical protein
MQNVRVVQRNLVYVVGLPIELCYEDMLSSADYIGQYGKIVKVSSQTPLQSALFKDFRYHRPQLVGPLQCMRTYALLFPSSKAHTSFA